MARPIRRMMTGCEGGGPPSFAGLALLADMTLERAIFDDPAAEALADARAEADVREGRTISHGAVKRWLQSWGKPKLLPRPRIGD